jgi:hypothetical protein
MANDRVVKETRFMIRMRYLSEMFALLLLALPAASTQAAEGYLKLVPCTALAWGVTNHMSEGNEKLQKLGGIIGAPAGGPLDEFKKEFSITRGLDEKGPFGFFVLPGKTEKDPVLTVAFFAVESEKEFLGNFKVEKSGEQIKEINAKVENPNLPPGAVPRPAVRRRPGGMGGTSTQCVCFRNGFAMLTSKKDKAALEATLAAKQDISGEMAGFEPWLAENDGSVAGTAAGIKYAAKQTAAELKTTRDHLMGPDPSMAVMRTFMDGYIKLLELAPSECSLALAGIRCDKQGSIRVLGRARLINGGVVSKAMIGLPPVAEKLLTGVPGGPFIFAAGGVGIPKLADGYLDLALSIMKGMKSVYGMSDEEIEKATKESFETFRQVRSMNMVMKTSKRGDPLFSNIYSMMRVENSAKILDAQVNGAAEFNKLMQTTKGGTVKSTTIKRLEIAGRPALQQEVSFDTSSVLPSGADRAAFDEMLGAGGKMLFYHVAADEHTVLMGMGVSQERMAAALGVIKQPRGVARSKALVEDADVNATAAMLPAGAQWVVYFSPRGLTQMSQRITAIEMKKYPGYEDYPSPDFPKCPPVGIALTASPAELDGEIAVPAAMIAAMGEYNKEQQKMWMNRIQQRNGGQAPAPTP